jgi:uncharacterized membrane protein
VIFLIGGLLVLGEMRHLYLHPFENAVFAADASYVFTRYISFAFLAALIFVSYQFLKLDFFKDAFPALKLRSTFDLVFYFSLWVLASSELINQMDFFGYDESYKLGLSILWGVYALFLVVLGIAWHRKRLRIGAFVLFALTLAKVFFYDIAHLDTISKTVVFVSLGILLLIISFLYNKYKHLIVEPSQT